MIVGVPDAGFEPLPGPPAWAVFYTAAADLIPEHRVAFRPLAGLTA